VAEGGEITYRSNALNPHDHPPSSFAIVSGIPSLNEEINVIYWENIILAPTFLGQNGSGQNGTANIEWIKWYRPTDKRAWTKWYGQNGTDKTVRIKSSINPVPTDNTIFS